MTTRARLPEAPPGGDLIRLWRERNGWTQLDVCGLLGISERTIRNWETGEADPPRFLWWTMAYLDGAGERVELLERGA